MPKWRQKVRVFVMKSTNSRMKNKLIAASILVVIIFVTYESFLYQSEIVPIRGKQPGTNDFPGLLLHPEIIVKEKDNFKIWPTEVTQMKYDWLVTPQGVCEGETFLVVFVHSRPHFKKNRQAIRDTWGSQFTSSKKYNGTMKSTMTYLFFSTALSQKNTASLEDLKAENAKYNDIIMFDFVDSYFNVTLKSLMDLKWSTHFCPDAKFVAKMDDDVFLDISRLFTFLESKNNEQNAIYGEVIKSNPVERKHPKWAVPKHLFYDDYYPPYMKGPIYIMTRDVALKIVNTAPYIIPIQIDDVYITGILAKILDFRLVNVDSLRVMEKIKYSICLVDTLSKIALIAPTDHTRVATSEEAETHWFQYILWTDLTSSHPSCSYWSVYYHLRDILNI